VSSKGIPVFPMLIGFPFASVPLSVPPDTLPVGVPTTCLVLLSNID
jgi:hypothetical protein